MKYTMHHLDYDYFICSHTLWLVTSALGYFGEFWLDIANKWSEDVLPLFKTLSAPKILYLRRGYYLFHHVILCSFYSRAATNQERRLLN